MSNKENQEELMQGMKAILKEALKPTGISSTSANQVSEKFIQTLRHLWGGSLIYITKGHRINIEERNKKIRSEVNGTNHCELSRRHDVSMQYVYKLLRNS